MKSNLNIYIKSYKKLNKLQNIIKFIKLKMIYNLFMRKRQD